MYAELFGIQNPSAAVENAAQWVQWVQAGILAGAAENDATIRYNLDQFWKLKAAAYGSEDQTGQSQLDRLDTFAHGYWEALEAGKIYSSSPAYWDYWKKFWFGGTPDRPEAMTAATQAAAAAAGQQASAQRVGGAFGAGMSTYAQNSAANIPNELTSSNLAWKQKGLEPLGIPMWAWIAGAVAIGLIYFMPKSR